jgi:hypothetical protein
VSCWSLISPSPTTKMKSADLHGHERRESLLTISQHFCGIYSQQLGERDAVTFKSRAIGIHRVVIGRFAQGTGGVSLDFACSEEFQSNLWCRHKMDQKICPIYSAVFIVEKVRTPCSKSLRLLLREPRSLRSSDSQSLAPMNSSFLQLLAGTAHDGNKALHDARIVSKIWQTQIDKHAPLGIAKTVSCVSRLGTIQQ